MTLYSENPVEFPEAGSISVNGIWHSINPLLAVASFSQERGGFVIIFDDLGESLKDINYPVHRSYQVTALAWHPERTILMTGWENGELKVWSSPEKDFVNVVGSHKAPIILLEFSEKGGRLVSCDSSGSVIGWKVDNKGETNLTFHLDLKESVTHLTFRLTIKNHFDFDVEGLARAAVNGDERALDMFSNWRPKTTARKFRVQDGADNMNFFVATQAGSIYYVNNGGSCTKVLDTEGVPLSCLFYHPLKDAVIVMMEGFTVGLFSVSYQGDLSEVSKVKLSGRVQTRMVGSQGIVWAGNTSLAILTGDLTVRLWDIETNDNYVLSTVMKIYDTDDKFNTVSEIFTCITYCKVNQTLCAGTNIGRIYFWTRKQNQVEIENPEDSWELTNVNAINGTIKQLKWGSFISRLPLLSVNCVTSVYIMKEQRICSKFSEKIWGTQKTASQILLESAKSDCLLQLDSQVTDMAISENLLAFTNGKKIFMYAVTWEKDNNILELNSGKAKAGCEQDFSVKPLTTFNYDNDGIALYDVLLITINSKVVSLHSSMGSLLTSLTSGAREGEPIGMDVTSHYLTTFTMEGYLKIYDLISHQPKLITPVRNVYDMISDFGEIIQAKTNSKGNKVALTLAAANLVPDGKLYVWDIEKDDINVYDFRKYNFPENIGDYEYSELEQGRNIDITDSVNDKQLEFDDICRNRVPIDFYWDNDDSRLLVCVAKKLKMPRAKTGFLARSKSTAEEKRKPKDEDQILITMFISSENSIRIHDIIGIDSETRILACSSPFIITLQKMSIVKEVMNDFIGLETCDKATREAILDFSYNLTLGNMDAAFKSIKLVQSRGVWASLARMCVKTRRLDVAGVCLGHMGNAAAARALKVALMDDSIPHEAKVAVLAVHLGMLDEAEQLYIQCGRHDLQNKLLRSRNKMDAAHAVAESKDRINLRNTEHAWAKSLELSGEFEEAAARYERANTHLYDIPRMFSDHPQQLQAYMSKTKDNEMLKWWGQYVESQGDMSSALKIYASAGDIYSQVRVLCFMGKETVAADLARSNSDKAAFYHMARYYETVGNYEEAVNFFTKATAYCNAVRLCEENNMSEELWNLSTVVSNNEKIECAKFFEEHGELEKSVVLYYRGGMLHKALDLAFKTQQYEILQEIATQLDANSDPALVQKCAEYFVSNEQFDKAVDLLAVAKKYTEAIDLCLKYNVQLSEDLSEKLTPAKDSVADDVRMVVLETLAESLMLQGNYHLATKKFTQAGDKIRAMKALLKSGDTEKVIFFAGVSRQREIYIMAANYLQSLDWQNQPEILRNIITFYSKGKALDLLANFYVACAQVEIDEFQNYEKAFGALTEASRCLQRITSPKDSKQIQKASEIVQQRLAMVKKFVDIRRLFERGDAKTGVSHCQQLLLSGEELEPSVRRGDIYALMIHHYVKNGNFSEAKQMCFELRQDLNKTNNMPITYYLNKDIIEELAKGLGIPVEHIVPITPKSPDRNEDNAAEFIEEVFED
ncbi:intraflagellar transport protein rempA isoform X2 [Leptinotarsa decemlineata]|uniref:intraflagellar transport protein rempA isoform X2 n=1 Tax=Leptinotarsa decemlineata TaxID=7539 RepID=UPI003D3055C6